MKRISSLLVVSLIFSACSKTVKEVSYVTDKKTDNLTNKSSTNNSGLINRILESDAPNVALAEVLSRTIPENERENARAVINNLSGDEIRALVLNVKRDRKAVESHYLFHGMKYKTNEILLKNSLIEINRRVSDILPEEEQVKLSVFTYIKNKALDEIVSTYSNRVEKLAAELSEQIALEVAMDFPEEASQFDEELNSKDKETIIAKLAESKPVLEKIDKYLVKSGLNENEQYAVVGGTSLVVGSLYLCLKDNGGFQKLLKNKKLHNDIRELVNKGKELMALAGALEKHVRDSKNNLRDLRDGIEGSKNDFREMLQTARTIPEKSSDVHSKRIMDFFYKKVVKGKDLQEAHPSILSKQIRINENLNKTINAVGNIADNLSNILGTTDRLMTIFKMKPSKDLQKVMKTAQTVADVVSTAKSVMAGFTLAGPVGAFGALCGSPALSSVLGGGGGDSAALKMIDKKLNMILENQKIIIEAQMETMKMVKDLALLVDQYHMAEMRALAELRDLSLVNLEISKTLLNKDIRSCERLINYQLSSVWKEADFRMDSFFGINELQIINSRFYSNIHDLKSLRRVIHSVEANGFEKCQNGIVEAFGGNSVSENPLRSLFSTTEETNLLKFQRETYQPLVSLLYSLSNSTDMNSVPLHIPAANKDGVLEKAAYISKANEFQDGIERFYELEDLISTKGLERYLSQLLILHPLLELDKDVWSQELSKIVDTYLVNSNSGSNQNIRSFYFLSNALKLVQSAIAQESILAGEPFLVGLHNDYLMPLLSETKCETLKIAGNDIACVLRANKLLMKNLLIFTTAQRAENYFGDYSAEYLQAYNSRNVVALAKLISLNLDPNLIKTKVQGDNVNYYLSLKGANDEPQEIRIPSPEGISEGSILYSENMDHLIKMQKAVIENLEKVAPIQRQNRSQDLGNILMSGIN